jgi:hypothetical protein
MPCAGTVCVGAVCASTVCADNEVPIKARVVFAGTAVLMEAAAVAFAHIEETGVTLIEARVMSTGVGVEINLGEGLADDLLVTEVEVEVSLGEGLREKIAGVEFSIIESVKVVK